MRPCAGLALGLLLALLAGLLVLWALRPGPAVPAAPAVRGRVSAADGPLAGARVRWKATVLATETDALGHFRLPARAAGGRVTAWKDGFLIAGASPANTPLDLRLRPLPPEDNPTYEWVDPAPGPAGAHNCANCHAEIYREWAASGHSRSATGRHFRNLYDGTDWHGKPGVGWGLVNEHPDGIAVCASCHAPAIPAGDPALFDLRKLDGVAAHGVHCDYCHKVAGLADGTVGLTHGRYNLRLLRPAEGQLFFGPLDDVDRGEDAYSPLYRDSRYCASCHEGVVFGVHVYGTYSEWLDSPARRAGKQCQDCHMAPTGRMTNFAPGHGGVERGPATLGNHRFFRGNQAQMPRDCVQVSAELRRGPEGAVAEVRVRADGVGHRVPTGFIDRHLLLVVEGLTADGKALLARTGPTLPAAAGPDLAGRPGRLYAKFLRDPDGNGPVPFWREGAEATDTRLSPGEVDRADFVFPAAVVRLRTRLLYRRFWQEVARGKGWPDRDLIVNERTFDLPGPGR
jgi:hypothetical protein